MERYLSDEKRALLGDHEAGNLNHLSLFSGIGGLDLAAEMAGFRTVGQCEWADYPTKVLEKHWPDVPRWRDIRTLTGESFYEKTGLRTVDVISGGFPCQPFSVAGKRRGKEDDRYLWPEMLRVISELRPAWVVGENVAGIVNMALDQVYADLENEGYVVQAFIIPACAVAAPHRRDRVCIVGRSRGQSNLFYSNTKSNQHTNIKKSETTVREQPELSGLCSDVSNTESNGLQRLRAEREQERRTRLKEGKSKGCCQVHNGGKWRTEPRVGRVANGVPSRVDRLKCLGNAVVPQQFYPIFQAIADIERGIVHG